MAVWANDKEIMRFGRLTSGEEIHIVPTFEPVVGS